MSDIAIAGLGALALVVACFGLHAKTLREARPRDGRRRAGRLRP
jgi:hypothetical protein